MIRLIFSKLDVYMDRMMSFPLQRSIGFHYPRDDAWLIVQLRKIPCNSVLTKIETYLFCLGGDTTAQAQFCNPESYIHWDCYSIVTFFVFSFLS